MFITWEYLPKTVPCLHMGTFTLLSQDLHDHIADCFAIRYVRPYMLKCMVELVIDACRLVFCMMRCCRDQVHVQQWKIKASEYRASWCAFPLFMGCLLHFYAHRILFPDKEVSHTQLCKIWLLAAVQREILVEEKFCELTLFEHLANYQISQKVINCKY